MGGSLFHRIPGDLNFQCCSSPGADCSVLVQERGLQGTAFAEQQSGHYKQLKLDLDPSHGKNLREVQGAVDFYPLKLYNWHCDQKN